MENEREAHNAYMRERIKCDKCNGSYTRTNKQKHMDSSVHKKNSNDPKDLELYMTEITERYEKKIQKLCKERDLQMQNIDREVKNIKI